MSRTRLIRPEFFQDELMAGASIGTRLVYIGLWTLCDDAGYFERGPRQMAATLFPYDGPANRERLVTRALDELEELRRIRWLDCAEHGIVPTIPDHRIKGGEQLFTVKKRHERRCSVGLRRTTSDSVSESVSDSGSVSVSRSAQARETTEPIDFAAAMAANGLKPGIGRRHD